MTTNPSPIRLALATCARLPQLDEDSHFLWQALVLQLAAAGIVAEPVVWNDPTVDWARYAAVWLRSPWDYTLQRGDFMAWIEHLKKEGVALWNAPEVLRWNTDKRYLNDLSNADFPALLTVWLEEEADCNTPLEFDVFDVIVKPIVGASGKGMARGNWQNDNFRDTIKSRLQNPLAGGLASGLMVQPYCPAIETEGEISVVYWARNISHATQKKPAQGEFRIHPEYGGRMEGLPLKEPWMQPMLEQTQAMVAWCEERFDTKLLYARADYIKGPNGQWCLNELELTEPCLYAHYASPQSIELLGKTLIQRLSL